MDGPKSPNHQLGVLPLPIPSIITRNLTNIQLSSDIVIQLTQPSYLATNMSSLLILENNIRFPKTPKRNMFLVDYDTLNHTGMDSNVEHSPGYGYDLVPKGYLGESRRHYPCRYSTYSTSSIPVSK